MDLEPIESIVFAIVSGLESRRDLHSKRNIVSRSPELVPELLQEAAGHSVAGHELDGDHRLSHVQRDPVPERRAVRWTSPLASSTFRP